VLFHEHADEGHKVERYDAWHIPYDHDENVKEEAIDEHEHKQEEELDNMDTTRSQSSPRGGEDSPQSRRRGERSEAPRRSSCQIIINPKGIKTML